ncbi:glycosyltransferase family 4 protein [Cyclobacteriaceae bacterium]|nr:glycosyltransferase family 4 protein [Cyclobacteriaceae bacterium]
MKVLHLSSERTWRGGEQQIAYLIEGSIKAGLEVHIAAREGSAFVEYCQTNKFNLLEVGFKNEFDLGTAFAIKKYCKQHNIDIIHMHSSHSHAIGVWSKILGNPAKLVLSRRVDFPVKDNFASRFKFNYPKIAAIICISNAIKEMLEPDIKRKEILHTVLSGIDTTRFETSKNNQLLHAHFELDSSIKLIGNISAIADHKDYYAFIDTAELVLQQRNDVRFVIIGDGPMTEEITNYIASKNLSENILLTGFRNDIPDLIQELDTFLMTSKTEGLGTTVLDAFANNVPVVATKAGGIPEAVIHRQTGLLADIKDSQQLAKLVQEILDKPELKTLLTEQAHQRLLDLFTKESMVKGNLNVYKTILA